MTTQNSKTFKVAVDDATVRLDVFLGQHLPDFSRSFIAKLAQDTRVFVNDKPAKPSLRLKPNDTVRINIPESTPNQCLPENIPLEILFEDQDMLVINKPAGLVVYPAPGHETGTLINAVLYHCPDLRAISGEIRPGIVHRLDQDTSGVMVIAKNNAALENLAAQFKNRQTKKVYLALVLGSMQGVGEIDQPIGRSMSNRKKISVNSKHKREALTRWEALRNYNNITLLRVRILTGRTHQIRVHLAHMHHPIVGDTLYGVSIAPQTLINFGIRDNKLYEILRVVNRQMLHAAKLTISHPVTGQKMSFSADLPSDMRSVVDELDAYVAELYPDKEDYLEDNMQNSEWLEGDVEVIYAYEEDDDGTN